MMKYNELTHSKLLGIQTLMQRENFVINMGKKALAITFLVIQLAFLSGMAKVPFFKDNKCVLCGREIHKETATTLTFENGEIAKACCLQCSFHYGEQTSKKPISITVTDFYSQKSLDAKNAFYITGGDFSPCCKKEIIRTKEGATLERSFDRCLPSIIAFEKKEDALKYLYEHGGTITDYKELSVLNKQK